MVRLLQGIASAAALPLAQVIGCVVHASTFTPEPGLVGHKMGQGLIIGEPLGGVSARVQGLAGLLQRAGFDTTASADVRRDIWYKLWGNITMNPLFCFGGLPRFLKYIFLLRFNNFMVIEIFY